MYTGYQRAAHSTLPLSTSQVPPERTHQHLVRIDGIAGEPIALERCNVKPWPRIGQYVDHALFRPRFWKPFYDEDTGRGCDF